MVFGVFDGLHEGHQYFLRLAQTLCDELVVVVAVDEAVRALKGRVPKHSNGDRIAAIRNFNPATVVVSGDDTPGQWSALKTYVPDVVFLGYDQKAIAGALKDIPMPFVFLEAHRPEEYKSSLLHNRTSSETLPPHDELETR